MNKDTKDIKTKIKTQIKELFKQLGITPNLKGYHYLIDAILDVYINKTKYLLKVTALYKKIADKYEDTPASVERVIRNSITKGCKNGDMELWDNLFGYIIARDKIKPTNSLFIFTIVEALETINE